MFTGIIEKTGLVAGVADQGPSRRIAIISPWNDLTLGQSIAMNGCCLTVADLCGDHASFDAVAETLARTNLGRLKIGDEVHLERALRVGDRLDGHMVQGHVDATAEILARHDRPGDFRLALGTPDGLGNYIVPKGSICLDGVSLTVAAVGKTSFEVALIPTTISLTALGRRPVGWPLNLEIDILAKQIVFWLEQRANLGHIVPQ